MSRLDDVLDTLITQITAVLNGAGVVGTQFTTKDLPVTVAGGQVLKGNPLIPELVNIAAMGDGNWQITLWPLKPKASTRFSPYDGAITNIPAAPVSVVQSGDTLTFSTTGAIVNPVNIYVIIGDEAAAYAQAVSGDTANTIATKVANAVNGLALSGVSASATNNVTTLSGVSLYKCNVGGTGTVSFEVARFERPIQVTIWATDPHTRSLLQEPLEEQIGGTLQTFLNLPDNTGMYVDNSGVGWDDDSQSGHSLYISHHIFTVEYGVMYAPAAVQLEAVENIVTASNASLATVWAG